MASPPRGDSYDYTEGASAIDIQEAIRNTRRTRRDSRYGEDGGGSMFDGPGNEVIPSSVSRMSLSEHGRRSSEGRTRRSISRRGSDDRRSEGGRSVERPRRRMSGVSATSYGSMQDDGQDEYPSGEEDEEDDHLSRRSRPKLHTPPRSGVFENLANIFGRGHQVSESPPRSRRPSISSRSSRTGLLRRQSSRRSDAGSDYAIDSEIDSADERWGYSSGEEDDEYDSEDENRGRPDIDTESMDIRSLDERSLAGPSLPLMSGDPIFGGEERIEMGELELLDPPPPGPPSRQSIYIADEDAHVRFVGYETQPVRQFIWRTLCVLTFGILGLIGHWFPRLWLRWVAREKAFKDLKHGFIVAESAYRDIALFPVRILDYPYHISTVFPAEVDQRLPGEANGTSVILDHLLVVDYRYARFALDPRNGLFSLVKDWRDPSWVNIRAIQDGISKDTETQRQILFGDNVIDIEGKSTLSLLIDEVIHPFYVFQIASIILWSLDDYYYYAFCIALISAISIFTTLVETKKTITRMREMSRFSCTVNVYSDGKWQERESTSLVPGDIINLNDPPLSTFPADLFLLSGDAIVNESMLTGESVPVSKIPIKDTDLARWKDSKDVTGDIAKSFLYAGTKVVRIRNSLVAADGSGGRPALGLVVRTGFDTTKGALVRSMLFPKPMGFKFYRDSIRFILVLAGLAGLGFCASAVQFVRLGVKWHTILLRALDLITVVVPPALPATLSIGTSFAIGRLRKLGIFCISPSRVNVGGKINVCCFDKTGTLTEDGLDILGVRAPERNAPRFGELIEDVRDLQINHGKANFLYALATCHSLKQVDGHVIGDPLDVKMFEFTKWTLEEGHVAGTAVVKSKVGEPRPAALVQTVVRPPGSARFRVEDALKGAGRHAHFLELGVIRTFEFVSALRRMSVIVKRLKSNSMEVYVKGAPEVMADICEKDSFPQDYDDLLSYYTKRGYRVIAIAGKSIEGLSWLKAQKMKREQAESGLRFLGLVIFENKLKPGTTPAIQALRQAHLACRMITGDNPLTAVSVARECGLINQAAHVFAPTFIRGNAYTAMSRLEWTCMDEEDWKLDSYSLKPIHASSSHNSLDTEPLDHHDYTLVVTGDVFRWMINHAPLETLQRMLVRTQIYARMSPDEKNEIVERLQGLGYTVLMCGDGANDCAALKAADVGISLSEAEASVAAPFTSRTPDISCVLEVIKEGRAALVTSFSCFKYMALYSLIQFTTITLLYSFASSLGDFQFLYIDLFIIIPIAVTMGRTLPYPRIHPKAPTASLVSKKVLASIIGQILITSAVQFWAYFWVRGRPWYAPPTPKEDTNDDKLEAKNYENSVLFLISCFQYILVAAVFSIGPPYRKPMYTNVLLMASIVLLTLFNVLVLLFPPKPVATILELMTLPFSARLTLLGAAVVNVAVSMAYERWGTQFVSQIIGSIMQIRRNMRVRDGKTYKAVEGGMRS
ncbi:hypothetical protein K474DRAFT_1768739 [Panus rudis PR-1116 ss-1]|nr:hypothetical protein K474DRAFT_1768739 [Panus rudis PR-1116 ss-1]